MMSTIRVERVEIIHLPYRRVDGEFMVTLSEQKPRSVGFLHTLMKKKFRGKEIDPINPTGVIICVVSHVFNGIQGLEEAVDKFDL